MRSEDSRRQLSAPPTPPKKKCGKSMYSECHLFGIHVKLNFINLMAYKTLERMEGPNNLSLEQAVSTSFDGKKKKKKKKKKNVREVGCGDVDWVERSSSGHFSLWC
jgi:hypothetical protein